MNHVDPYSPCGTAIGHIVGGTTGSLNIAGSATGQSVMAFSFIAPKNGNLHKFFLRVGTSVDANVVISFHEENPNTALPGAMVPGAEVVHGATVSGVMEIVFSSPPVVTKMMRYWVLIKNLGTSNVAVVTAGSMWANAGQQVTYGNTRWISSDGGATWSTSARDVGFPGFLLADGTPIGMMAEHQSPFYTGIAPIIVGSRFRLPTGLGRFAVRSLQVAALRTATFPSHPLRGYLSGKLTTDKASVANITTSHNGMVLHFDDEIIVNGGDEIIAGVVMEGGGGTTSHAHRAIRLAWHPDFYKNIPFGMTWDIS